VPVVIIFLIKYMAHRDARVRYKLDDFKIRVWVIGPIFKKIILARFANYFALLYSSGVTVLNSLRINEDITGNMVMSTALREMQKKIADGNSISDSIDSISLFPPLVRRMIKVGETTGELDTALDNVSYFYDREVKGSIEKMQSILGPVLTIFLAVNIGWVMLSVFWPLYDVIVKVAR
jgi:type IV pilus assembly protein PilC